MKAVRAKKKTDRRIQRTRHSLTHAMVDLVTEKRFDDITVQNPIDRADIGRSTFYTHFRDKEDLFQTNWEAVSGVLRRANRLDQGWQRVVLSGAVSV